MAFGWASAKTTPMMQAFDPEQSDIDPADLYGPVGFGEHNAPSDPFAGDGGQTIQPVPYGPTDDGSAKFQAQAWQQAFNAPSAPSGGAPTASADPFASMGGGVQLANGGWVPKDHPLASQAGAQTSPSGGASVPGAPGAANPQTIQQGFYAGLQRLLGADPSKAGQNVATSPAVTAFNTQQQRQEARDRALLAERAAANGFSGSGGFEAGVLGLRQKRGEAEARFAGEQAGVAEQNRQRELLSALAMAQAMGDADAARQLQMELARMNVGVQNAQIGLGQDRLGFDYAALQNQMNTDPLRILFGG